MKMRLRFFSVFLAVLLQAILLLAPTYIVFANEDPPDFTDGGDTAAEQIDEETDDVTEDIELPETDDGNIPENGDTPEIGDIPEDENLPDTENGDIIPEQVNEPPEIPVPSLYNEVEPDFIGSQEAFENWLSERVYNTNVLGGGSIKLGADITIEKSIMLSGELNIETGAYGVTMNGGVYGPLSITGDGISAGGTPIPVLTVVNVNVYPWDFLVSWYNVTARGRDGKGGVAVRISTSESGSSKLLEGQGHIRSEGKGAVGVEFVHPVNAHYLSVSVKGENSAAINAPNGTSLYYGRLEASGDGSKIVSGGSVLLDTCKISGNAGSADVINRKIVSLAENSLYWPLAQGQSMSVSYLTSTFYKPFKYPSFLLSGNEAHPAEFRSIPARWNRLKLDSVNTSILGKTVISGDLDALYQGLGLEGNFSLDLTVDVQKRGKPRIVFMTFGDDPKTGLKNVSFRTNDLNNEWLKLETGNFILWRSDDEGQSWYNFTDSVSFTSDSITYKYDKITKPAWFCIQEIGGEYSNIAAIYGYEGKTYGSLGGDRTGVDRGGEGSVTTPAPTPTPEPAPEPAYSSKSKSRSSSSPSSPDLPLDTAAQTPTEIILPPADVQESAEEIPASPETSAPAALPDEWENDTATAISGKRLRMMMSAGNRVTFIKKEIRLSFDAAALETLDIGDNQLFTVAVARPEQLKYTVTATLDGSELYGLPCVATLNGYSQDILASGTYDFAPMANEPDVIPAQTHLPDLAATQPSMETAGEDKSNNLADMEEKPFSPPPAVLVLSGVGCVIGAAVFVKFRVKKYGR